MFLDSLNRDFGRIFKSGAIHVLVMLICIRGISFVQQVGLARIFEQDELGTVIFILRVTTIVCVFADFGINTSVLKYSSENIDKDSKREVYKTGLLGVFFLSIFVSFVFILIVYLTEGFGDERLISVLYFFSLYIPFTVLKRIPPLYLQAQKQLQKSTKISGVLHFALVVFILSSAALYGLWGYFVILVVAQPLIFFIFAYVTREDLLGVKCRWNTFKKMFHFGFFSVLANFSGVINSTLGVLLLKWFDLGYEEIAIYGVATIIIEAMRLAPKSLIQTVFPYLVAAKDDPKTLKRKIYEIMWKQGLVVMSMSLLVSIAGYWMIPLLFGENYMASWPCVVILSGALTLWSIGAPFGKLQMTLDQVRLNFTVSIAQLVMNFIFCCLLIPDYGAVGAAWALLLSRCLHCLLQVSLGYKTLNALS